MADFRNYNADRTKKRCASCRKMLSVEVFRIKKNHGGRYLNNVCRPCEQAGIVQYRTMTPRGAAAEVVRRTKYAAKTIGVPHDLTTEWVLRQLDAQQWRCLLTGIPFRPLKREGENRRLNGWTWNSISCDRIVGKKGYVTTNVRLVLNIVNLFRNDGDDKRMFMVAEALIDKRKTRR